MDLLYRSVQLEHKAWEAATQLTMEEDVNVPEAKADCMDILLKDARLVIEEVRTGRDQVAVKGSVVYQILYAGEEPGRLEVLKGSLPVDETLHADGAVPGEMAGAKGRIEDFKVSMINTRKIAIQSVLCVQAWCLKVQNEDWCSDAKGEAALEKQQAMMEVSQLVNRKQDVYRIREEVEIPGGWPPIQTLLWQQMRLGELEARPMEGKISLKGELNCFFIYIGQGTAQPVKMLEKQVPFHGTVDCGGCNADMRVSCLSALTLENVEIKQDEDGEDRVFYLEAVLDLQLRVYEEKQFPVLKDAYSTLAEAEVTMKELSRPVIALDGEGRHRLRQTCRIKEGSPLMVQILHTMAQVLPQMAVWSDNHVLLRGSLEYQILYQTGEERMPYCVCQCSVPYEISLEGIPGQALPDHVAMVLTQARVEEAKAELKDSEEMELRGVIAFDVLALGEETDTCVGDIALKPLDTEKYALLPGMVLCFAQKDTDLFTYGKQYYTSVEEIKSLNHLTENCVHAGQKVFLVKGNVG
ncbi:MAG: DUF3794 domain-containing protein [Lachnospiraceae bacterium]|nr:DUF3794 domain-containing protein [Lachnospiraceae bacterium]